MIRERPHLPDYKDGSLLFRFLFIYFSCTGYVMLASSELFQNYCALIDHILLIQDVDVYNDYFILLIQIP